MARVRQLVELWEGLGSSLAGLPGRAGRWMRKAKRNRKGGVQKNRAERIKKQLVVSEPKAPTPKQGKRPRLFARRNPAAIAASAARSSKARRQTTATASSTEQQAALAQPKPHYQFVNPNAWRFETPLPREVLLGGSAVAGLEDFAFVTERRAGVLTASDTRSGQPVIMQLLPRGPLLPADLTLWALYQQRLGTGHPYIQQLQEVRLLGDRLAVVLEDGTTTVEALVQDTRTKGMIPPEAAVRRLFQQLIIGLHFCHRHGLERASLHPADLALHGPLGGGDVGLLTLKLHDFSCSGLTGGDDASNDPAYLPPEVLAGRLHGEVPDAAWQAADIWSAGAVLFALLTGEPPFEGTDNTGQLPAPTGPDADGDGHAAQQLISVGCVDLLRRMLHPDPAARLTALQITHHPWFRDGLPPQLAGLNQRLLAAPPQLAAPLQSPRTSCALLGSAAAQLGAAAQAQQEKQRKQDRQGPASADPALDVPARPSGVSLRQHFMPHGSYVSSEGQGSASQSRRQRQPPAAAVAAMLRGSQDGGRRQATAVGRQKPAAEAALQPRPQPAASPPLQQQGAHATAAKQQQGSIKAAAADALTPGKRHNGMAAADASTPGKRQNSAAGAAAAAPHTPPQHGGPVGAAAMSPAPPHTPPQTVQKLRAGSSGANSPRSTLDGTHCFVSSSVSSLEPSEDSHFVRGSLESLPKRPAATVARSSDGSVTSPSARRPAASGVPEIQPAPLPSAPGPSAANTPGSSAASTPGRLAPGTPAQAPPPRVALQQAGAPGTKPKLPPLLLPPRDGRRQSTAELVALIAKAATTGRGVSGRNACSTAARQAAALQHMLRLHSIYQGVQAAGSPLNS